VPVIFWYAAETIIGKNATMSKMTIGYILLYGFGTTVTFSAFYPPA
jgi:hypothetical protein